MRLLLVISSWLLLQNALAGGRFQLFLPDFPSPELKHSRHVYVYLPPHYNAWEKIRYPVLYLHDGQNLFDPQRAYLGQTWEAEQTLNRLIRNKIIPPIIVVGIDNTPDRLNEYTPDYDPSRGQGGRGDAYLNFIARELKPEIDLIFRTLPQRENTGIMGSSLGGLISLYAGAKYHQTFGLIGGMSPSIWWNHSSILKVIKASHPPLRVYLDSGTEGGELPKDAQAAAQVYQQLGLDQNLRVYIKPGAGHSEKYWAQRLPLALQFLFAR